MRRQTAIWLALAFLVVAPMLTTGIPFGLAEVLLLSLVLLLVSLPMLVAGVVIQLAMRERPLPEYGSWLAGVLVIAALLAIGSKPPVQFFGPPALSLLVSVVVSARLIESGAAIVRDVRAHRRRDRQDSAEVA